MKKKLILPVIGIAAILTAFPCLPVSAMNNIGGYYENNNHSESATCSVSINAYCTTSNSFVEGVPCKIKNSSGQYLSFNYFLNTYSLSSYGGDDLLYTDNTGGLTVNLPAGQYTIVTDNMQEYSATMTQIPFTVAEGATAKSVDIEYEKRSGDISISFSGLDGVSMSECTIQVEDAFGNLVNFFSVGNNYSYITSTGKTSLPIRESNVTLSGFPVGSYVLKFSDFPAGLEPAMPAYPFNISNNGNISINIEFAAESSGQLSIANVDSAGNILTGSSCSIVSADNVILGFTKVTDNEYKYDKNGSVSTMVFASNEPLFITGLPLNTEYTINEVNSSAGYITADPQKVKLDSSETTSVLLTTKKTTGTLSIVVSDDTTNEKVADFSYTIFSAATKAPMYFSLKDSALNNSAYVYDEQGEITAVKTGDIGTINIEGLPAVDIIIKCKESPMGYVTDTTEIAKTIIPNTTTLCDLTVNKSNVAIEVIDENESPIIDVPVEIYNSEGKIVLSGQTNAKGKILLTNVAAGEYTYRLAGVPEGYSYIDEIKNFTITPSGVAEGLSSIRLEKTKIQVSIGAQEGNNTLENAVFVLYDAAGNEVSRALTSSSGIATFSGIGYGDYTVKQITAPIGYTVSDKELTVSIDNTYQNEEVFDFSGKNGSATGNNADPEKEDGNTSSDDNREHNSSFSVGDLYFIIVGILVICFVAVAALSFILKIKGKKGNSDQNQVYIWCQNKSPSPNPITTSQANDDYVDEEGVKIFTPSSSKPAPVYPDIDFTGKSPEELKKMEEQIRALIASKNIEQGSGKEDNSNERDT